MSDAYIGEIRMFGGNFAPAGWEFCNGQLLSIPENDALFALIGTTYGGDGQNTFGLPDLRGRIPVHMGTGSGGTIYQPGQMGGTETVTLTLEQLPQHSHKMMAAAEAGTESQPENGLLADTGSRNFYRPEVTPTANMNPAAVSEAGGNQPHENMMPYLSVSFIISLNGIFPTQS